MNIVGIASDIFIAAMAVFGLWCVFQFLSIDLTSSGKLRCAVNIVSKDQLDELDSIVYAIDRSALFAKEEKYALLLEEDVVPLISEAALPVDVSDRVEFYVRAKSKIKEKE